jgi:hypothetical protein
LSIDDRLKVLDELNSQLNIRFNGNNKRYVKFEMEED